MYWTVIISYIKTVTVIISYIKTLNNNVTPSPQVKTSSYTYVAAVAAWVG